MTRGIDTAAQLTAKSAAAIKAAGFEFVGRYLVPASGSTKWKALTKEEAEIISEAGLRILTVFETSATRAQGGKATGTSDGRTAFLLAKAMGIPEAATIYFAVDYDAPKADYPAIAEYLKAAARNIGGYGCGVYGAYGVIEEMAARQICRGYWQCVGWSYGKKSAALNVYQREWGKVVAGVTVDIDECPDMAGAGIWTLKEEKEENTVDTRYQSIADMPEWAQPTIRKLCNLGYLQGNTDRVDEEGYPADLNLSLDMIRLIVINDRAGCY